MTPKTQATYTRSLISEPTSGSTISDREFVVGSARRPTPHRQIHLRRLCRRGSSRDAGWRLPAPPASVLPAVNSQRKTNYSLRSDERHLCVGSSSSPRRKATQQLPSKVGANCVGIWTRPRAGECPRQRLRAELKRLQRALIIRKAPRLAPTAYSCR